MSELVLLDDCIALEGEHMLSTDPVAAAARQLKNVLRATFQSLEAFQFSLTVPEHVHVVRAAASASAALGKGDRMWIERSLVEMGGAAAILARAENRR